jgi:hypothetical protein
MKCVQIDAGSSQQHFLAFIVDSSTLIRQSACIYLWVKLQVILGVVVGPLIRDQGKPEHLSGAFLPRISRD